MMVHAVEQQHAWRFPGRAFRRILVQDISDALLGWGLYLTVAIGLAFSVLRIYNTTRLVAGSGVQTLSRPFASVVFWGITLALLYVTVTAARSLIRSRDVAPIGRIGVHLVAGIVVYALLALLYVPLLWLLARFTNAYLPPALLWAIVMSIPIAGLAVSFGLFLSAVSGSIRGAMVLMGAAMFVVLLIQGGHAVLLTVSPAGGYDALLIPLRGAFRTLDMTLAWISPFGMLRDSLDAALRVDYAMAVGVLARAVAGMLIWVVLAIGALRRYEGGGMRRWGRGLPLMALLVTVLVTPTTHAQAPARTEAFAYGLNAAAPDGGVIGTLVPPAVDTVYLLADRTSVVSSRRTEIYFWPITNQYRAAWSSLNETVKGTLEIFQGGRQVAALEQQAYTIHFLAGDERSQQTEVYFGAEARLAQEQFEAERDTYQQTASAYQEARITWQETVRDAQQRRNEGEEAVDIPLPPLPPEPFTRFSNGLNQGYAIELPAGTYQMHVRQADGEIVPESRRRLVTFAPRRTAVGYTVMSASRWTIPEELQGPPGVILAEPDAVLYLKPHAIREYPARAYEHLLNPQYAGDAQGREWAWAVGEPLSEAVMLEIVSNGEVIERIPFSPYHVEQVVGGEFGYEIVPFESDAAPRADFGAYRIAPAELGSSFMIRLVTPEGTIVQGSDRQVRAIPDVQLRALLLLPLFPLLVGAGVLPVRQKRTTLSHS